jgi:Kazal-type serine protease inhibitor domain
MTFRHRFAGALGLALLALLALPLNQGCQSLCTKSSECATGEYCSITNGACLTSKVIGFCKQKPDTCSDVLKPVCGCDGETYKNACDATRQGTPIASEGMCGASCGGPSDAKCAAGEFCDLTVGTCGQTGATGTCRTLPKKCADFSSPVCGCDGHTYDNACKAEQAQVSIGSNGECTCGGSTNIKCLDGRICLLPTGACLGVNPTGTCKTPPNDDCPKVASPVCGCDGVTYTNACLAAKAGINVATSTACNKDAG